MLQTVIILIGKYQLKDDVLLVVKQRVFYTKTLPRDRSILVEFHFFFHGRPHKSINYFIYFESAHIKLIMILNIIIIVLLQFIDLLINFKRFLFYD